jgi:hypothetical protein
MYIRKTRHDYDNFKIEIQEMYLCIKYQFGHHKAGRYLKRQFYLLDLIDLFYGLEVMRRAIPITFLSLKKSGLLKNKKNKRIKLTTHQLDKRFINKRNLKIL